MTIMFRTRTFSPATILINAALPVVVALSLLVPSARASGLFVFEPVAILGDAAPGTEPGTVFGPTPTIYTEVVPTIAADGQLAFAAMLEGAAITAANRSAVWAGAPGAVALVARAGAQVPGMAAGITFGSFPLEFALSSPLQGAGRLVFRAGLVGPGIDFASDEGAWSLEEGTLALLIREGDAAPGMAPGVRFGDSFALALSVSDRALVQASIVGPGISSTNNEGFWSDRTGSLGLVFREGDAAPGMGPGIVFGGAGQFVGTGYSFGSVCWNASAEEGLDGSVTGPGVDAFDNEAVYIERDGELQLLAREDDPAPGVGHNADFGGGSVTADFGMLSFNGLGQAAFLARIGGGGIPTTYTIFSDHTGALSAVVVPGSPAPGTEDDFGIVVEPFLSEGGRIAFRAALAGAGSWPPLGIWWDQVGAPGTLSALVVPGETATDRPGVTITSAQRIIGFNANGELAFLATIEDASTGSATAIVVADPSGNLRVVVATGDLFDLRGDGSEYLVVSTVSPGGLNAMGQMAMRLDFADGRFGFYRVTPTAPTDVLPEIASIRPHLRCAPNPFSAETQLVFDIARPGRIEVNVFDVAGRSVARLVDSPTTAGRYHLAWDGRDRSGSQVPAGVYWARVRTPSGWAATRLVRVGE